MMAWAGLVGGQFLERMFGYRPKMGAPYSRMKPHFLSSGKAGLGNGPSLLLSLRLAVSHSSTSGLLLSAFLGSLPRLTSGTLCSVVVLSSENEAPLWQAGDQPWLQLGPF